MFNLKTVTIIQASDAEGCWYDAVCQDHATALYYLAQKAARCKQDLHRDSPPSFYQIGEYNYELITYAVLDLAAINKLRKEHEPCSGLPLKPKPTHSEPNRSPMKTAVLTYSSSSQN